MCLPVGQLGAAQTRHCVFQILAEVKNILHSPLPLGIWICVKIKNILEVSSVSFMFRVCIVL